MFLLINLYVNPEKQPEPYRFVGRNQEMKNKSNGAHGTSWSALSSEESQCPGLVSHKERSHRKHPTPPLSWTENKRRRKLSPWLPALSRSCYAFPALSGGSAMSSLCISSLIGPLFLLPLPEPIQPDTAPATSDSDRGTSDV